MRHRSLFALAALLAIVPAAPAAAAPPPATAVAVSTESLHVYLVLQLAVPEAVARDSVALREVVSRAGVTVMSALGRQQIPVYRAAVLLRSAGDSSSRPAFRGDSAMRERSGYRRDARLLTVPPNGRQIASANRSRR